VVGRAARASVGTVGAGRRERGGRRALARRADRARDERHSIAPAMTDFLEQVGAERMAYVMETRPRVREEDVLSNMRYNLWSRARAAGALDGSRGDGASDAFTSALALAKREGRLAVIAEVKRV